MSVLAAPRRRRIIIRALTLVDRAMVGAAYGWRGRSDYHLLVTAPGGGNIGDQAMADTFVENVDEPVVVVMGVAGAITLPSRDSRVTGVTLSLIYRKGHLARVKDSWRFGRLLRHAATFTLTGADTMDGGYSDRSSINRWNLVSTAAALGVPTQILGFSWNAAPSSAALKAAHRANVLKVRLLARDPLSARRMMSHGLTVIETADSVFSLGSFDADTVWVRTLDEWRAEGRPIAIINASALVTKNLDQIAEYKKIVEAFIARGFRILLLPHVMRGEYTDFDELQKIAVDCGDNALVLVNQLLTPAQVRALLDRADIVVTGRMHLAIMALSLDVPSFVISTQGKVEGLAELFGVPELAIEARAGLGQIIVEHSNPEGAVLTTYRASIHERRRAAVAASAANFSLLRENPVHAHLAVHARADVQEIAADESRA